MYDYSGRTYIPPRKVILEDIHKVLWHLHLNLIYLLSKIDIDRCGIFTIGLEPAQNLTSVIPL